MKPCLVGYFLCSNTIFHLLLPPRGYFLPLFATSSSWPPHTRAADEATAALKVNNRHSTYATAVDSGSSRNNDDTQDANIFLTTPLSARTSHFIRQDLLVLHVCVGSASFSRYKLPPPRGDRSTVLVLHLLTRTSNTEWNKSVETMQLSMSDHWPKESPHHLYLCTYLRWKKVFMMHSALLLHSYSRSLPLSLTRPSPCRPITYFHTPASFPTWAVKSPKSIADSFVLILRRHH